MFSPFPRYVSLNLYSFLLYFCLLVIISFLVVSCYLDMIMSRPRLEMFEFAMIITPYIGDFTLIVS